MRLRTRRQYQRMTKGSCKLIGQWLIADMRLTEGPSSRLGMTITKRFGSSPQRNRLKRLVREAFRLSSPHFALTCDILIRPRSQAAHAKMQDIQQELLRFIEQIRPSPL